MSGVVGGGGWTWVGPVGGGKWVRVFRWGRWAGQVGGAGE